MLDLSTKYQYLSEKRFSPSVRYYAVLVPSSTLVTEYVFACLARNPFQKLVAASRQFQKLERLTVILYDNSSPSSSIVQKRKELFCHGSRTMEKLPPTQNTLLQHIRWAVYQTGIWATSTLSQQRIPSPRDYGWTKESGS